MFASSALRAFRTSTFRNLWPDQKLDVSLATLSVLNDFCSRGVPMIFKGFCCWTSPACAFKNDLPKLCQGGWCGGGSWYVEGWQGFPLLKIKKFQTLEDDWFLGFLVSRFLGLLVSTLFGLLVSWLLGADVPKFQSSEVSKLQRFNF